MDRLNQKKADYLDLAKRAGVISALVLAEALANVLERAPVAMRAGNDNPRAHLQMRRHVRSLDIEVAVQAQLPAVRVEVLLQQSVGVVPRREEPAADRGVGALDDALGALVVEVVVLSPKDIQWCQARSCGLHGRKKTLTFSSKVKSTVQPARWQVIGRAPMMLRIEMLLVISSE